MICKACSEQQHADCEDIYQGPELETGEREPLRITNDDGSTWPDDYYLKPGLLYRACVCQHRWSATERAVDAASAPAEATASGDG